MRTPGFGGAWKAKIAGLVSRAKKANELSPSVVKHDKLDDGVLGDMIERALLFRTTRTDAPEVDLEGITDDEGNQIKLGDKEKGRVLDYIAWEDLFDDVFRCLHTYDEPELKPANEVKPSRELNRRIIQQITSHENFQKLRPDTRHSPIEAAFTAISMAERLQETLQTELVEFVVRAKEMADMEDEMPAGGGGGGKQEGQGEGSGGGGGGGQSQPNLPPIFDKKQKKQQQPPSPGGSGTQGETSPGNKENPTPEGEGGPDSSRLEDIAQQLAEKAAEQQQSGLGASVMQAIEQSLREGQEGADIMSSLPGLGPGSETRVSPEQMIELAKRWRESPILRNVSRMTGRLQRDMRQKRARRVVGGVEEIVDVTTGNDLAWLLPHELAKLKHPLLKRDFMRQYHEKTLLEYETEGSESAGRGPIVICIDGSGSMGGAPNEWARSVALALITIARKEKRDAAAVEFSSSGQIKRWEFLKKERFNPDNVLDFTTHFFGGGTQIASGMLSAKEFIDTRPEFRKADIVLITDGQDYFNDERDGTMRQQLQDKGVRVHGVAIGSEAQNNGYLQQMCDSVVSAYDMAGPNEATTHIAEAIN